MMVFVLKSWGIEGKFPSAIDLSHQLSSTVQSEDRPMSKVDYRPPSTFQSLGPLI